MNEEHAAPSIAPAPMRPRARPRRPRSEADIERGINLFILAAASFLRDASAESAETARAKKRATKRRPAKAH